MGLVRPAALLLLSASVVAAPDCPAGTTAMGSTPGGEWAVCEATARRDGGLVYTHRNGSVVEIEKTAEALFGCGERGPVPEDATAGCNASIDNPTYLAQLNGAEPSYSAMKGFLPPMVYDGGYNKMDPVHFHGSRDPAQDGAGHFNVHTWTGSRSSSTDAAFDSNGADISEMGYPTMNQFTGKYGRSSAVFKNSIETLGQKEGLWGGWLPIVTFHFKVKAGGGTTNDCACDKPRQPCPSHVGRTFCPSNPAPGQCDTPCTNSTGNSSSAAWIEWTACPVADMQGNRAQDVFFRVVKLDAQGAVLDARYFDTYSFRWADAVYGVPGMGAGAGSATAARFYGAVLDQRVFWDHTFAVDGVMRFELPASNATDGKMLAKLVWHSVVRDMIIRADTWFPRYGIQGQWSYGAMGNDNCDITLRSSMELALEIGAFDFARGVLENFFRFDLRQDGPRYRGPSFDSNNNHIEHIARYFTYTKDPTRILVRYFNNTMWLVNSLRAIRAQAKQYPQDNPSHGIPAGDTIDDVPGSSVECGTTFGRSVYDGKGGLPKGDCLTQLPFYGISFGMVWGFRALGAVYQQMGGDFAQEGAKMLAEAEELRLDVIASIQRSKVPVVSRMGRNETCFPGIAGWGTCTTDRHGKPNYTPPTIDIVAGALQCQVRCRATLLGSAEGEALLAEIVASDRRSDDSWDYDSNLEKDDVHRAQIALYDRAANQLTRGTWTGAEVAGHGLSSVGSGASTVTSSTIPGQFKQLIVYDHPTTKELWLGRAMPRDWLAPGERVALRGAPTRGGRIDLKIRSAASGFAVNISLPSDFTWPDGGLVLRLRSPSFPGKKLAQATVGGKAVAAAAINATDETVRFQAPEAGGLQSVAVTLA